MNFDLYSYKYTCPRWYGYEKGVKNIYIKKDSDVNIKKLLFLEANKITGSKSCDISLLNKFEVSIKSVKTYPALTGINFTKKQNELKQNEKIKYIQSTQYELDLLQEK